MAANITSIMLLLQDACVLINLLGSGRFADIVREVSRPVAVSASAARETLSLRDAETGEREPIELRGYIASDLIQILDVETERERARYVAYAAELEDGEAMSLALAECRGISLATDDCKARRLINEQGLSIELWSTVDILKAWAKAGKVPAAEVRTTLRQISMRARYRPRETHPDWKWWNRFLRE
jgi:predicted nucleic acid-binding protein